MPITNDQAWRTLFEDLDIDASLDNSGLFNLSADQIKSITGKEPRNMSKWDSREARPETLRKAGVTILPTSRQGYALIKGDGYQDLPQIEPAIYHSPAKLQPFTTLPWRKELTKESVAIDVAAISSMLKTFTKEDDLALTIRGRSGTSQFSFDFQGLGKIHRVAVDRAQIEVDAGFEGEKVWLIEAKIGEPDDFLVRQLFYPWRLWQTATSKSVVPLFLTYTNKTFGLFRYRFVNAENYHSLELLEKRWFAFDEPEGVAPLGNLYADIRPVTPQTTVFPQADTLGTVIAAIELYAGEASTPLEVSTILNFAERQGGYYTAAAEWLGFVERSGVKRRLTESGRKFIAATRWQRLKLLFQAVAATPVFREFIRRKLESRAFGVEEIAETIRLRGYANPTTSRRRAKTVVAWLDWLWREHANLSQEARGKD